MKCWTKLKTHWYEELDDAVQDFYVLVFQPAAQHCGKLWVLLVFPSGRGKSLAFTSRPILLPPGMMWGYTEGQNVTILKGANRQAVVHFMNIIKLEKQHDIQNQTFCERKHNKTPKCSINLIQTLVKMNPCTNNEVLFHLIALFVLVLYAPVM